MKRLADLRATIGNVKEADAVMQEIALLECEIAYSAARRDKQILAAKARHATRTDQLLTDLGNRTLLLTQFILANQHLFKKPRKRATDFGSFGMQTVSDLLVTDPETCIQSLLERGYEECYKEVRTPIKPAIKKRLEDGETIPGCTLKKGDTAVYKTSPAMLSDAKEKAAE